MTKKALLVGCNYPRAGDHELHGCVNDAREMYKMLEGKFGFAKEDMVVLEDTHDYFQMPTGANIRTALYNMVQGAQPGDTFFFHFSGHGTRIPPDDGEVDDTGFDECICPCDLDMHHYIRDNYFRELISKLPSGTTFTIVADSCQSGGLIDGAKEQIGDSYEQVAMEGVEYPAAGMEGEADDGGERRIKKKELSAKALVQMLRKRLGREDIELSNLRSTLQEMYGNQVGRSKEKKQAQGKHKKKKTDSSSSSSSSSSDEGADEDESSSSGGDRKKKAAHKMKKKIGDSSSSSSSDESDDDISSSSSSSSDEDRKKKVAHKKKKSDRRKKKAAHKKKKKIGDSSSSSSDEGGDDKRSRDIVVDPAMGILVSGCQSHQFSVDITTDPPHGVLTHAIITVLQMLEPAEPVTNRQLVMKIRRYLTSQGLPQQPGLYCTDEKADQPFICPPIN